MAAAGEGRSGDDAFRRGGEPDAGATLATPRPRHGFEDRRVLLDEFRLEFDGEPQHAPRVVGGERRDDTFADAKVGVALVRAFDHIGQTQNDLAKFVGGHDGWARGSLSCHGRRLGGESLAAWRT